MTRLRLALDLTLPLELVTESMAILAVKRAGKSHTAKKIVEQLHHAHQQVVVVDPKGDMAAPPCSFRVALHEGNARACDAPPNRSLFLPRVPTGWGDAQCSTMGGVGQNGSEH